MATPTSAAKGNPLVVIGDVIGPQAHLIAFMENLRTENALLDADEAIKYAVCRESTEVAVALRRHLDAVKMILLGPGLIGNNVTVARMLAKKAHIVMVVDPDRNPLGGSPEEYTATQKNLEELGVIIVLNKNASHEFFEPLVQDYVLSGLVAGADLERAPTWKACRPKSARR